MKKDNKRVMKRTITVKKKYTHIKRYGAEGLKRMCALSKKKNILVI